METDQFRSLPDEDLVERFRLTGDPALFGEIFRRHRTMVYRCCLKMLRDPESAADITQETFIKALLGIQNFNGGQLRAWLATIARHQCINQIRSLNRGPRSLEGPEELEEVEVQAEDVFGKAYLRELLAPLTEPQRRCLQLFYYNGLSYEEIAKLTGLEKKTVRSHIGNGMRRLRKAQSDCGAK